MTFEVQLSGIDGYEVTVEIFEGAITSQLARAERDHPDVINQEGLTPFDLSRFAVVRAEPTDEKWSELAGVGFGDDGDDETTCPNIDRSELRGKLEHLRSNEGVPEGNDHE